MIDFKVKFNEDKEQSKKVILEPTYRWTFIPNYLCIRKCVKVSIHCNIRGVLDEQIRKKRIWIIWAGLLIVFATIWVILFLSFKEQDEYLAFLGKKDIKLAENIHKIEGEERSYLSHLKPKNKMPWNVVFNAPDKNIESMKKSKMTKISSVNSHYNPIFGTYSSKERRK